MRSTRFTEEQILAVLAEGTSGVPILEVCQRHGITKTTYYRWKSQYSDIDSEEARRLRRLEEENGRLKRIIAEQALSLQVLRDELGQDS